MQLAGQIIEKFLHAIEETFGARAILFTRWATKAFLQIFQQLLLFIVQTNRRFDNHAAQQIALRAAANGLHAFTAHPEQLTCLRLARYFKIYTTVQRRDFDFTAESSHSEVDRYFTVQIISFTLENGVLLNLNLNIQIACRCAMLAGFTFTCQTNTVAGINARRDFNRQRFRFLDAAMTVTFIARIFDQRTASLTVRTGLLNGEEATAHLNWPAPWQVGQVCGWLPALAPLP